MLRTIWVATCQMPQVHSSEESQDHTELRQKKKIVKLFLLPCTFNQSFVYLDKHVKGDLSFKICLDRLYIVTYQLQLLYLQQKRYKIQRVQIYKEIRFIWRLSNSHSSEGLKDNINYDILTIWKWIVKNNLSCHCQIFHKTTLH
jgi:hypothetical protein